MRAIATPDVEHFCALVRRGLDAWTEAGKLLCALKKKKPNICVDIIKHEPSITLEILRTFERLGSGEIYAPLLIDGSMGARKLLTLPYGEQLRLCNAKISVAVLRHGEVMVEEKAVTELTKREAETAFNGKSVRPIKEQMDLVRPAAKDKRDKASGHGDTRTESLDDDLDETVSSKLGQAQAAMIRARELMVEQKIEAAALDELFTIALNAVGNLRFELSEAGGRGNGKQES